jgi:hypothetical protein
MHKLHSPTGNMQCICMMGVVGSCAFLHFARHLHISPSLVLHFVCHFHRSHSFGALVVIGSSLARHFSVSYGMLAHERVHGVVR